MASCRGGWLPQEESEMAEEKKKNDLTALAVGFIVIAGGAWFQSPASRGCASIVSDATWRSGGEERTKRLVVEVRGGGRSAVAPAVAAAVKQLDANAVDVRSRTVDYGFCAE
jgi:hypothetical protein